MKVSKVVSPTYKTYAEAKKNAKKMQSRGIPAYIFAVAGGFHLQLFTSLNDAETSNAANNFRRYGIECSIETSDI